MQIKNFVGRQLDEEEKMSRHNSRGSSTEKNARRDDKYILHRHNNFMSAISTNQSREDEKL